MAAKCSNSYSMFLGPSSPNFLDPLLGLFMMIIDDEVQEVYNNQINHETECFNYF